MKAGIYQPAPIARATLRTIQGQRLKQSPNGLRTVNAKYIPTPSAQRTTASGPLVRIAEPEQRAGPKRPRRRFCSFGQREKRAIRSEDKKCEQHVRSRKGCSRCEAVCAHQEEICQPSRDCSEVRTGDLDNNNRRSGSGQKRNRARTRFVDYIASDVGDCGGHPVKTAAVFRLALP